MKARMEKVIIYGMGGSDLGSTDAEFSLMHSHSQDPQKASSIT